MRRFLRVLLLLMRSKRIYVSRVRVGELASGYCWCIWSMVMPASASRSWSSSVVAPSGAVRPRSSSCDLRKSGAVENPLCSDPNPPSSVSINASSPCIARIWSASIPEMVDCVEVDDDVAAVDLFC